ncbi:hypothetical protein [Aquimarina spongiae]|uniref:Uncharacterized protein n=1 Tax=Aquimarina spongiae TaxID=570521 RepID=A0A1M6ALS9_9FLAO|nr:hypothetical protein [Aquimarina spongiae]SHI37288.1 hypothetical protein SAMN04488508_101355 [Aquimarina spongiae]
MKTHTLFAILWFTTIVLQAQENQQITTTTLTNVTIEVQQFEETQNIEKDQPTYPVEEYKAMIARCKELSLKIIAYDRMIQEGTMKRSQRKAWKRDLMEAKLLNYRIDDFTNAYLRQNYSLIEHVDNKSLSDYYDFSKVLESANKYAGF